MLHTTKSFELGNTIYFECIYQNTMGILTDPDNPDWQITTGRGVVVANGTSEGGPFKRSDGLWYIFWTSDQVGDYTLEFTGEMGGHAVKIRRPFKVQKAAAIY